MTEPSPPENRVWPCWGRMDTVKAVFVVFLGVYILLGEGPRWIGSGDEGPVVDAPTMDGMQKVGDTGELEPPRSARMEDGFAAATARWDDGACSEIFEGFSSAEESRRSTARTRDQQRPDPPARFSSSESDKGPPPALRPDECAPRPDHPVVPSRAPTDAGH